jgi:hypothetical protein
MILVPNKNLRTRRCPRLSPDFLHALEDLHVQALVPDPESLGAGAFTSAVKISEGRPTTPWIRERLRELG